ncbi:type I polyketide synthase [Algibacillus agarilyticus]|uniref:type I polyketide synthase n=1 Tax=Algibacillus agarilyticus TaxID=2234133 RepID=UPI000DD05CC3|nr:type I polyketide synthase [Algibacillus agarilyticus]
MEYSSKPMDNSLPVTHNGIALGSERTRYSVSDTRLVSLLQRAASDHKNKGFVSIHTDGSLKHQHYGELLAAASCICGGLQTAGVKPRQEILLQIEDAGDLFNAMWGCILAGAIPIPLNVALTYNNLNQTQKLVNVWHNFAKPTILTSENLTGDIANVKQLHDTFEPNIVSLESLKKHSASTQFYQSKPNDVAVLFLTSGSTGIPKGVPQTHENILAMVDGTIQMNGFTAEDVTLNWMSMDHAGSLVFLGVMGVALKCNQFHVPIAYVLQKPLRWLDLINEHRVSISWAPNFVFSLFLENKKEITEGQWDLSCMRFMVNAGEAIVTRTARDFIRLLQQHKLPENALRPAFGMVETCSGITWSTGFTLANSHDDDSFVDLGPCIPGAAIRIVDENENPIKDEQSGRLQLKGPSVFSGYHNQPELNKKIISDGWLTTGDLAYLRNGHLFITGREKDIIIINGNNFYCHEIEGAVEQLDMITRGNVAACGVTPIGKNTEQLAILYHCVETDKETLKTLNKSIRSQLMHVVGVSPSIMIRLEVDEFPRTAIGKIQRPKLKTQLEEGLFKERSLAPEKTTTRNRKNKVSSALTEKIADIWRDVLELDELNYDETFFELGGHSLLAFQVQAELEKLIGRQIAIVELFNTPTIQLMAEYFDSELNETINTQDNNTYQDEAADQDIAIAVIGVSCRLPGAEGPQQFWNNLKNGNESITFYTADEAINAGLSPEEAHNPNHVHAAPILNNIEGFDADFWKYSAREARIIDPQQRIFLETAWEAFEDAGYKPDSMKKVGVFASAGTNTYLLNNIFANSDWVKHDNQGELLTVDSTNGFNVMITNDKDYLPMRVSYKLNLTGPSVNVQTACSSTLVAIHEACKSLRAGESETALAGGCAAMLPQFAGHLYSEGMLVTPDGHCRAYDANANGTIFGSGSAAVLLKRLDKALEDRDNIYAVIRGSAVTNDGGQKMGFTAPSMMGEYTAARKALERSGISADTLGLIEGHGTGTPLGDPIEVQALSKAIRHDSKRDQFCALGSVKTNIGHMGIASGIAGALKAILAIKHKQIPATLHYDKPNPQIDFETSPFFVNNELLDWEDTGVPRRAGVNSLGIGGTNAHVIFEESPELTAEQIETNIAPSVEILPLAAKTPAALTALTKKYIDWLETNTDKSLRDICFTAQKGREHFPCRLAVVASSQAELKNELQRSLSNESFNKQLTSQETNKGVVFLFTGQGAQYKGMAQQLYNTEIVFKNAVDECCALFTPLLEQDLIDVMFVNETDENALINQTNYTQPALFVIQIALISLLEESGVNPTALVGHSIGEYAAAWCAGVLNLEDAVKLVAARGRLMQSLPAGGEMASVFTNINDLRAILSNGNINVSVAANNAPNNQVISGQSTQINAAINALENAGVTVKRLVVSHAFHSDLMTPILQEFKQIVESVSLSRPTIEFISTLTGETVDHELTTADYWVRHISETVNCQQAIEQALSLGYRSFVELGPHSVMSSFGLQIAGSTKIHNWLPCLKRNADDNLNLQQALAKLYQAGHDLDWDNINKSKSGSRVSLPTYPWQRVKHWIEPDKKLTQSKTEQVDPLLGQYIALPHIQQHLYQCVFEPKTMPVLADHVVFDHIIPPGAMYASKMMRVARDQFPNTQVKVENLMFMKPMVMNIESKRDVQVILSEGTNNAFQCELSSYTKDRKQEENGFLKHASAQISQSNTSPKFVDLDALKSSCTKQISIASHQSKMQSMNIELGTTFDWLSTIQVGTSQALAAINPPDGLDVKDAMALHPGMIDAHWQVLIEAMSSQIKGTVIPFCVDSFTCYALPENTDLWCHAEWDINANQDGRFRGDIKLIDVNGQVLIETKGLELRHADESAIRSALEPGIDNWFYNTQWQRVDLDTTKTRKGDCLFIGEHPLINTLSQHVNTKDKNVYTLDNLNTADQITTDVTKILADSTSIKNVVFIPTECELENISLGCQQFLAVIKALIKHDDSDMRLALITQNSQNVLANNINISHAPFWGIAAALKHEQPQLSVRCLDLDGEIELQGTADYLLTEDENETQVTKRQGSFYAPTLASVPFITPQNPIALKSHDVQVILGGHGGLGLIITQWLIDCGAKNIIIAGRNKPTDKSKAFYNNLIQQGINIETQVCDATEIEDVKQLINNARQRGNIQSVFHLAGTRDDGFIQNLNNTDFNRVLLPKLLGAWNLHEALTACSPEHVVFFSSVASVFGSAGQAAYAAGNAALDALAHYRHQQGLPALSINWGPWSDVGMAANMENHHKQRLNSQGYDTIAPTDGLSALAFSMDNAAQYAQLVVAPIQTKRISELAGQQGFLRNFTNTFKQQTLETTQTKQPLFVKELTNMTIEKRKKWVENYLLKLVKDMLQVDLAQQLDVDKGLFDLGMDSLTAVEVKDRLERDTGCKLRSTLAFDHPTIRRMAAYLVETLFVDTTEQQAPEVADEGAIFDDLSESELAEMLMQEMG